MRVSYLPAAEKQMARFGTPVQRRIKRYMTTIAALDDPRSRGKALKGNLSDFWCYRVGDYRVICKIVDDELVITVVKVGHRSDVYDR